MLTFKFSKITNEQLILYVVAALTIFVIMVPDIAHAEFLAPSAEQIKSAAKSGRSWWDFFSTWGVWISLVVTGAAVFIFHRTEYAIIGGLGWLFFAYGDSAVNWIFGSGHGGSTTSMLMDAMRHIG